MQLSMDVNNLSVLLSSDSNTEVREWIPANNLESSSDKEMSVVRLKWKTFNLLVSYIGIKENNFIPSGFYL